MRALRLGATGTTTRLHDSTCAPPCAAARPVAAPPAARCRVAAAAASLASAERAAGVEPALPTARLSQRASEFAALPEGAPRYALLLSLAKELAPLPERLRSLDTRVMGCTSQTWLALEAQPDGTALLHSDSDSAVTRGFAALLLDGLRGLSLAELAELDPSLPRAFGLGPAVVPRSRSNGFSALVEAVRCRAAAQLLPPGAVLRPFPSLLVSAAGVVPQGAYAEATAAFLNPPKSRVDDLAGRLRAKRVGVVAHFYMDAEVQGVLTAAKASWPHIAISDSLAMADAAVAQARAGCTTIAVLGVDFMSENVRAILDDAGFGAVKVYRLAEAAIGCTLAEAAERDDYFAWLAAAAAQPGPALHVVYINTSLRTKALADAAMPTITCTSSNVVATVLTAAAQVPGLRVYYGPDSYMGANLGTLLRRAAASSPEEVAALHPDHTPATIASLLPRLYSYPNGACVVHELFGAGVASALKAGYSDAFITAHFEVPGELFGLAMAARARGMGAVGSTQNILDFILARTDEALARDQRSERLRFILGTETGMTTAIVDALQRRLAGVPAGSPAVDVEIVFPVSTDAVAQTHLAAAAAGAGGASPSVASLAIVPGPAGGEGCSPEGGCASCPYMKMNTLAALSSLLDKVGTPGAALLAGFEPEAYTQAAPRGGSIAQAGCVPILHMRGFQTAKRLPDALVSDILARARQ